MNTRLQQLRDRTRNRGYREFRHDQPIDILNEPDFLAMSDVQKAAKRMTLVCEAETPVILSGERIVFTRTVRNLLGAEAAGNICADWQMVISQGLLGRREVALKTRTEKVNDSMVVEFLDATIDCIDAVLHLADVYADEAREQGRADLATILERVPAKTPRTFHEALQSFKLIHSALWLSGTTHVTIGRFDQYMYPYYKADLNAGRITRTDAEELLAELFVSLNRDTDLYPGVQVGDNGQSLMLGGVTRSGENAVNDLTWMILRVSHDVNMIDPKINLRIDQNTDMALLTEGSRLTRRGLGFPQYSNDDVEIDALVAHGYSLEDARDYTVAACWEFIIPGVAMDVPNIDACSFPAAADSAIREGLARKDSTFESVMVRTSENIRDQVDHIAKNGPITGWRPSPFYSVVMTNCLESGRDINDRGVKYYNFGIHGSGAANAADALASVRKFVYEEKSVDPSELLESLETNFEHDEQLFAKLRDKGPKVGNNDERVDSILRRIFDYFADACEAIKDNGRGGIIRPGTGTAMYYVSLVRPQTSDPEPYPPVVGATADGRKKGDFISSSLAPSPGVEVRCPISVLQSFSKIDYKRICNGGPITMELSYTVFRNEESLVKVAMLVRAFVATGCQQLQLNVLNIDTLRDAQLYPQKYTNLIVRVWGWSGYFVELEKCYQDHIITRNMYAM